MGIPPFATDLLGWGSRFLLAFLLLSGLVWLAELLVSYGRMRAYARSLKYFDYKRFLESEHTIPVSIIVPICANKRNAADALDTLDNLLSLDAPAFEVIAVLYGEQQEAMQPLTEFFQLLPFQQPYKRTLPAGTIDAIARSGKDLRLIVAQKTGGSRADALNAGVNLSSYPIVLCAESNVLFERDALLKILYSFVSDPLCVAVSGVARIPCEEPQHWLERRPLEMLQRIERLRALYTNRIGTEQAGALLSVCDSFVAFKKAVLFEAGGFRPQTAGEEGELLLRMQVYLRQNKRRYSTRFLPDPICYAAPLEQIRPILAQRRRWHAALNRRIALYGAYAAGWPGKQTGPIALPYFWLFDAVAPALETIGLFWVPVAWLLGATDGWFVLLYVLLSVLLNAALSVGSVLLEEQAFQGEPQAGMLLWLYAYSFADGFWYRPLTRACQIGWNGRSKRDSGGRSEK